MLSIPPPQFRKRRRSKGVKPVTTPPAQVNVTAVLGGNSQIADWVFDANVVEVVDLSPLMVNGGSPTAIVEIDGNVLRVSYDVATDVGLPWNYDGTAALTFDNAGVLQPGSGVTQEG